jgi:biofilm PGA synthesis N-glycosyltransferase PgaC
LALTGNFLLAGPWTLFVVPVTIVMFMAIGSRQRKLCKILKIPFAAPGGLAGFLVYCLVYQAILAPVAAVGYFQELTNRRKRW